MGERLREAGIELTVLDFRLSPLSGFLALLALIRSQRPDVVQTWMYHADMLGGLAARLSGNRSVIWGIRATDLDSGDARATRAVRKGCAWLSRWVPHTIVCVAEAARRTHAAAGYDDRRMVVLPNGFDMARLAAGHAGATALRSQCGFADDDVVIGSVGRFNANKDQRGFVRSAGLLAQRHAKARFLMVGRDLDQGNAELAHWIAETGHAGRFVLLGERSDVPACLAAMDVFCLSSRTEGFPNAVGEAMAVGVPCVVTDVGDAAMLVADTGIVVPPEDPEALAKGMEDLLTLPVAARRELGRRARDRIESEFSIERACERFEQLYRRVMMKG